MAREIELKLSLDPQQAAALVALPWLGEPQSGGCRPLHNQYFDTPDRLLAQHQVALRIREQDGRYIQTLKTRGSSQGGLHRRNEWEWDLPTPALDYALLATAAWPAALQGTEVQRRIVPAFRTDFDRTTWMLGEQGPDGEPVLIELVLDQGEVTATAAGENLSTALCELELELKQGTAADLYRVAMQLAQHLPMLVSDISKAERGYQLLGAPRERAEAPLHPERLDSQSTFLALAQRALTRASRGFDRWRGRRDSGAAGASEHDWQGAEAAALACRELQALLQSFESRLPASVGAELEAPLLQLNRQLEQALGWRLLRPRLDAAVQQAWDESQAAKAAPGLDAVLADPATGRVLLGYGALLSRVC